MDALLFIDTNILLDFYRVRGYESGLSMLTHIESNQARIIMTGQVEMEYKKNRQRVILESLGKAKADWNPSVPAFLAESKHSRALEKGKKAIESQTRRMRSRIEAVLSNPAKYDPVYRVVFRSNSPHNLARDDAKEDRVRRLAWKRFSLGYPPRKAQDTSIGDAVNWEWIVHCSADSGKGVILVTRDSDYGHSFQKGPVLNDWLRHEFAERTSRKRKIILTERLAEAFKLIAVPVSKREEADEEQLIAETSVERTAPAL